MCQIRAIQFTWIKRISRPGIHSQYSLSSTNFGRQNISHTFSHRNKSVSLQDAKSNNKVRDGNPTIFKKVSRRTELHSSSKVLHEQSPALVTTVQNLALAKTCATNMFDSAFANHHQSASSFDDERYELNCAQRRKQEMKPYEASENSHHSLSVQNELSLTDLNQLYTLLHLQSFSKEEIISLTDAIVISPSCQIGAHFDEKDENIGCVVDSTTMSALNEDLQHITTGKLSYLIESRIKEKMQKDQVFTTDTTHPEGFKFTMSTTFRDLYDLGSQEEFEQRIKTYSHDMAERFLKYHILPRIRDQELQRQQDVTQELSVSKDEFISSLESLVINVDYKSVWPISLSMLLVGSSVGVIVPLMPFVAERMALTPGQYGLAVSSFALSKLIGNVPSAILSERHGRKPLMVYSLNLVALGVAGIGMATQVEHLIACRLLTGFGVAALSTAATLTIADISTPRNRASTMAPMNSSFAAGMAVGPAIGGLLGEYAGVDNTFLMVGLSYFGVAALNNYLLSETKRDLNTGVYPWLESHLTKKRPIILQASKDVNHSPSFKSSVQDAVGQWIPLMKNPAVRQTVTLNLFYWGALSGAQMTLLPLMLTSSDGMALSAGMLGQVYMGMSVVQVMGNPTVAKLIDRVGKAPSIVVGCTALSGAMFSLPMCTNTMELAAVLGCWALGSTTLSTAPFAYLADAVPVDKRAQALALLRTGGDVGFLLGATCTGALADWTSSMDVAMQACSGLLLTGTGWFAIRQLFLSKYETDSGPSAKR